jgi:sulfite exporter TauE/SafE
VDGKMQGLLLGLANGGTCLAFCAPVLVPYLMHEGGGIRQTLVTLLVFLGGRLCGYVLFGILAWAVGALLTAASAGAGFNWQAVLIGAAYAGLAILLLLSLLRRGPRAADPSCALETEQARRRLLPRLHPRLVPAAMGLLAGLRVCPPVLLAFTAATDSGSLLASVVLFLTFFLGTSVYVLPLALVGALKRVVDLRIVGRFAGVIVALYYLVAGVMMLAGGLR